MDEAFNQILDNSFRRMNTQDAEPRQAVLETPDTPIERSAEPDSSRSEKPDEKPRTTRPRRREPQADRTTALESFKSEVESMGVPLKSLSLEKADLKDLGDILEKSGLDPEQVGAIIARLQAGPLTMDRVMAVLATAEKQIASKSGLSLGSTSIQYLGLFLQDLGLEAQTIKEMLSGLEAGQKMGANEFRSLLLKHGSKNLKGLDLSGVDLGNAKDLLTSMGAKPSQIEQLTSMISQTGGRLSAEGFLAFLESIERPELLQSDQLAQVEHLVQKMKLSQGLRVRPYFNKIVSLLESMGDQEVDREFLSGNPAIQMLRGGAVSARSVAPEAGLAGQNFSNTSGGQGQGLFQGQTQTPLQGQADGTGISARADAAGAAARTATTGLPSNLSESVVRQISEKMVLMARNGQHQVRLNLNPPELGRVNIRMVLEGSIVRASIMTETAMAKGAVEEQVAQLRDNLAQYGLQLERFDVMSERGQAQSDLWGRERRFSERGGKHGRLTESDADLDPLDYQVRREAGRLDLMA